MNQYQTQRAKSFNVDTEIYANLDEQSGLWCVLGNKSGFEYANSMDEQKAKEYADELNNNKELSNKYLDN